MHAVLVAEALAFIDDCQQAGHRETNFFNVIFAKVDLAELFAHEKVRLKLVLLFEEHVPKLVKVVMALQSEFLGAPRATIFSIFTHIYVRG